MHKIKIQFLVGFLCVFGIAGCMPSKILPRTTTVYFGQQTDRTDVGKVFNQAKHSIQSIYEQALDHNKDLEGRFVVRLRIKSDGTVANVAVVSSALNNAETEERLLELIKNLRFNDGNFKEWNNTYTLNFVVPQSTPIPTLSYVLAYRYLPKVEYPEKARRRGQTGNVLVRVLIDKMGLVEHASIERSSDNQLLDQAALEAASNASFYPYQEKGVAIKVYSLIPVVFTLHE